MTDLTVKGQVTSIFLGYDIAMFRLSAKGTDAVMKPGSRFASDSRDRKSTRLNSSHAR